VLAGIDQNNVVPEEALNIDEGESQSESERDYAKAASSFSKYTAKPQKREEILVQQPSDRPKTSSNANSAVKRLQAINKREVDYSIGLDKSQYINKGHISEMVSRAGPTQQSDEAIQLEINMHKESVSPMRLHKTKMM
jgi:hypothetical protein